MEEEDDLLALGRDVPRQLDDPLLLVVLQIQGAAIEEKQRMKKEREEDDGNFWMATRGSEAIYGNWQIVFARINFSSPNCFPPFPEVGDKEKPALQSRK